MSDKEQEDYDKEIQKKLDDKYGEDYDVDEYCEDYIKELDKVIAEKNKSGEKANPIKSLKEGIFIVFLSLVGVAIFICLLFAVGTLLRSLTWGYTHN
jgi:hypothetical protein